MIVARFTADQRTNYRVPHTLTCALLRVNLAWFYKWLHRATRTSAASGLHTKRDQCRDSIDRAVKAAFANDPTAPNQVWQLDFSEFKTTQRA